jgi:hypothetical protein
VEARFGEARVRLLLDTGAATFVTEEAFERSGFRSRVLRLQEGWLEGLGGRAHGQFAEGAFAIALGGERNPARSLAGLWVLDAPAAGPVSRCGLDGSLGIDALAGCEVLLQEGAAGGSVRCSGGRR